MSDVSWKWKQTFEFVVAGIPAMVSVPVTTHAGSALPPTTALPSVAVECRILFEIVNWSHSATPNNNATKKDVIVLFVATCNQTGIHNVDSR